MACAVYTLNRVLNANSTKVPHELWFKEKPDLTNLRVFGDMAIIKKQAGQVKSSWDEKGEKCIFVGYTDRFNTYKFLMKNKMITSCNVKFMNRMHYNDIMPIHDIEDDYWVSGNINGNRDNQGTIVESPVQPPTGSNNDQNSTEQVNVETDCDVSSFETQVIM